MLSRRFKLCGYNSTHASDALTHTSTSLVFNSCWFSFPLFIIQNLRIDENFKKQVFVKLALEDAFRWLGWASSILYQLQSVTLSAHRLDIFRIQCSRRLRSQTRTHLCFLTLQITLISDQSPPACSLLISSQYIPSTGGIATSIYSTRIRYQVTVIWTP